MEVVATAKWVRTSAQKARLVSRAVEGMPVSQALTVLKFMPRAAADDIAKVIKSAAANAEHNYNLDASSLRVARIAVDGAAMIKRFRPKPRGMAGGILKRTAHLRAYVTDDAELVPARRRGAESAAPAAPSKRRPAAKPKATAETAEAPATTEKKAPAKRAATKPSASKRAAATTSEKQTPPKPAKAEATPDADDAAAAAETE